MSPSVSLGVPIIQQEFLSTESLALDEVRGDAKFSKPPLIRCNWQWNHGELRTQDVLLELSTADFVG